MAVSSTAARTPPWTIPNGLRWYSPGSSRERDPPGLGLDRLDAEGPHGRRQRQRAGSDGVQHGEAVLWRPAKRWPPGPPSYTRAGGCQRTSDPPVSFRAARANRLRATNGWTRRTSAEYGRPRRLRTSTTVLSTARPSSSRTEARKARCVWSTPSSTSSDLQPTVSKTWRPPRSMPTARTSTSRIPKRMRIQGGGDRKIASAHSCGSRPCAPGGTVTAYASDQSTFGRARASNGVLGSRVV